MTGIIIGCSLAGLFIVIVAIIIMMKKIKSHKRITKIHRTDLAPVSPVINQNQMVSSTSITKVNPTFEGDEKL